MSQSSPSFSRPLAAVLTAAVLFFLMLAGACARQDIPISPMVEARSAGQPPDTAIKAGVPGGLRLDPKNGAVAFWKGEDLSASLRAEGDYDSMLAEKRYGSLALRFIDRYADTFRLKQPKKELTVHSVWTDNLGLTHVRFQQIYESLPVFNSELAVHFNESGQIFLVQGRYIPTPEGLSARVTLQPADAMAAAANDASGNRNCDGCLAEKGILLSPSGPETAYQITVRGAGLDQGTLIYVDANSGKILHRRSLIQTAMPAATPADFIKP